VFHPPPWLGPAAASPARPAPPSTPLSRGAPGGAFPAPPRTAEVKRLAPTAARAAEAKARHAAPPTQLTSKQQRLLLAMQKAGSPAPVTPKSPAKRPAAAASALLDSLPFTAVGAPPPPSPAASPTRAATAAAARSGAK
jgi:hypothetical protein